MSAFRGPSTWLSRPLLGIAVIAAIVLLLEIPVAMIRGVIEDRVATRSEALKEITTTWGGPQSIVGLRLVVPYQIQLDSASGAKEVKGFASFLPASLTIDVDITAQALTRGLFTVPVYQAQVRLQGHFEDPNFRSLGIDEENVNWEQASLVIEVTDPKSVGSGSTMTWGEAPVELLPGTEEAGAEHRGFHGVVHRPSDGIASFNVGIELMGSNAIRFVPFSRNTQVALTSNWNHPSFSGAWLPTQRAVYDEGFTAEWEIPFLGRDYAQEWIGSNNPYDRVLESRFGVNFIAPIDHYRMSERSTKYAPLFLALTFGLLWLFDTLIGVRVHPIQYVLVGAAMCMFYLLELSLSEHIGFIGAYAVAAGSIVILIAAYTKVVLRSIGRGLRVGGALGLLYSYLLALLTLERYALLAGSLGLFLALAAVMYLTRWVDWDRVSYPDQVSGPA